MKKIYGFLGVAALLALGSCASDNLDGPQVPDQGTVDSSGDLFMTMNIAMASQVGTRTSTPNQGYEVGQEYENTISKALIILATGTDATGYNVVFSSGNINSTGILGDPSNTGAGTSHDPSNNPTGIEPDASHANQYKASFTFNRAELLADLETINDGDGTVPDATKKKTYTIFVVANPTPEIIAAATTGADIQQLMTIASSNATEDGIWTNNNFVMSSAVPMTKTIYDEQIKEGTCTTKETAYNLGTVKVQRAMSRFDLDTDGKHMNYSTASDNSSASELPNNIGVQIDAVAMVNMAKSAYLFKVMAENSTTGLVTNSNGGTYPIGWGDEREGTYQDWWTFTPNQENGYFNQLFTSFKFNSETPGESSGTLVALQDFFGSGKDWQLVSSLTKEDNTFEHEQHTQPGNLGAYRIWRYAMENTNPDDPKNQVNGNSTGVIFRAQLTGNKIPSDYDPSDLSKEGELIYAFNNVIIGTAEDLFTYVTNDKAQEDNSGIYSSVRDIVWPLLKAEYDKNFDTASGTYKETGEGKWYIEKKDDQQPAKPGEVKGGGTITYEYHHGDLSTVFTAENLVKDGKNFTIYNPTKVGETDSEKPVYYCYYLYWNRHNDNGKDTQMGNMEFASVRNNVYKLSVNAIKHLGHPGDPNNDPYPPTPGTPDEKDTFWISVDCQILPWEVRINNIEF